MGIIQSKILNAVKIPLLSRALDVSSIQHKSVSSNVANISTPGYQRKYVNFNNEMKKAIKNTSNNSLKMEATNPGHMTGMNNPKKIDVVTDKDNSNFNGINNVDIDREMGVMSENTIIYNTSAKLLAKKFQGLLTAIRGSR
ncbi:MAG: flagellar basal body rod protein FlgB [candidate division Zixibacteria bacterium]|nr:flagellar basal body rod protein FlgB [candidate division Zixibacteria bacterium]